jgi:nitrite reductase/ring-hydroxylating ferredoxin subunit/Fe-S cluster biogenesis protein NfuA
MKHQSMTESTADDGLPGEVASAVNRLDDLVKRFEAHPDPAVQERVFELLQCIDTMHRAGLRRLNQLLKTAGLQRRAVEDPEVRLLFDLYDLGEGGDESRAEAVVESLRPVVESGGGALELVAADAERVKVRLACAPGDAHVEDWRAAVEHALFDALPDVSEVEVLSEQLGQATISNFVPLSSLVLRRPPEWQPALALADLPISALRGIDVGDTRVMLARVGAEEVYAYRNECPGTPFPLDAAPINDGVIRCPWHGCRFEVRGGRRVDAQAPGLGVLPVRISDGQVVIAIPQAAAA